MAYTLQPLLSQIYLVQWITSFVDSGYLENDEESKKIFAKITTFGILVIIGLLPVIALISDKVSGHILIPLSFLFRGFWTMVFLLWVEVPDSWQMILVAVMISAGAILEEITTMTLFMRNMPPDVRGTIGGVMFFFCQLG